MSLKVLLISTFTIDNLKGYLNTAFSGKSISYKVAPFDQVTPTLLNRAVEWWSPNPDFTIVWVQPEQQFPAFQDLLTGRNVEPETILTEVEQFARHLQAAAQSTRFLFVPTFALSPFIRGNGLTAMSSPSGLYFLLSKMNIRLAEILSESPNIVLLNTSQWLGEIGTAAVNPKLWYLSKNPFAPPLYKVAAQNIAGAYNGLTGKAKKLLILDLDNTLWGGIVGDAGWQNLALGGHHFRGEAYRDFQLNLKRLSSRGVMLGIVSKNDEKTALEAIEKHPEMVLKKSDFVGWRINWDDKAKNIADLAAEVNVGLDTCVFLDDNPSEQDRVRQALPAVLVPQWPDDPTQYTDLLNSLTCFDSPHISSEDKNRAAHFKSEEKRKADRTLFTSVSDWLNSLSIQVSASPVSGANFARTLQLLNKTNQMNLQTRRLSENELRTWLEDPRHTMFVFRVSDKFGDAGLVGIASITVSKNTVEVTDFILSCRVMGKEIEKALLHVISTEGKRLGGSRLHLHYLQTEKNAPTLQFLDSLQLQKSDAHHFSLPLDKPFPKPEHIQLIFGDPTDA